MDKKIMFEKELNLIKDIEIKNFVENFLENVPDYFFNCAASSTGKYHPSYALGEGGLARHTKAAVRIAYELFRTDMFPYNSTQQDLILASLILHDTYKHGISKSQYTVVEHPIIAAEQVMKFPINLNQEYRTAISENIKSHMGKWNYDYKSRKEVLPKPKTGMQNFVHMCDYLASRKCLEFNFDAELSN